MTEDRHHELRLMVQADSDGELGPRDAAVVAAHLDGCAECRALQQALIATKSQVRAEAPRYVATERVRGRLDELLARAAPKPSPPHRYWQWGGWLASCGLGAAATALVLLLVVHGPNTGISQSVLDGHLRALQSGHLYDVASSDQHTVKPWIDSHLDFAPPVKMPAGFSLDGGRLDAVNGRAVAALVYGRGKHVIDLYVWPAPRSASRTPSDMTLSGYNLVTWNQNEMEFWAVSDLNRQELDAFVAALNQAK